MPHRAVLDFGSYLTIAAKLVLMSYSNRPVTEEARAELRDIHALLESVRRGAP